MSVYPTPQAATAAPSPPHTGFVPPGAPSPQAPTSSVYSANAVPFTNPFGGPSRQTGYSHPQQYSSTTSVPQQYQQPLSSYAAVTTQAPAAPAVTAASSQQPQKHQTAGSFQTAMPTSASLQGASVLTQPHAQPQPAEEEDATACIQEIAHAFVYQYYLMLHENPADIYRFYDHDSKLHRISDSTAASPSGPSGASDAYCVRAVGLQSIMHAFAAMDFDRATCKIRNIEAQEVHDGGILVLITGCLRHSADKPEREFVQTVLLAKMKPPRAGWYVHTEMFIYLDAMASVAAERAAAAARKEQQEELLQQRQRQLERQQQQQQQQQLEAQRKQVEQQQQQQHQQQQTDAPKHRRSQRQHEGASQGSVDLPAKREARQESPVPAKCAADDPQLHPAESLKCSGVHVAQQTSSGVSAETGEQAGAVHLKAPERMRNKWVKQDLATEHSTEEASPHWPKPGQMPQTPSEKETHAKGGSGGGGGSSRQQHNYDPDSFAFKVLQNVRPVTQRGFAVPATSSAAAERTNGEEKVHGRGAGGASQSEQQQQQQLPQQQQQLPQPGKRIIVLAELSPALSSEDIKRAATEALEGVNKGICVDLRKPPAGKTFGYILEMDSVASAQLLVERGLVFNGKQGGGRGAGHSQRGVWEDRRAACGESRRGGRGGGSGAQAPVGQERLATAEDGEEEADSQWIDPAARRRLRVQRAGGAASAGGGGTFRGRGGSGGFRRSSGARGVQE
ncbi:probable serine/threonine-protein kinase fhkB [Cyclospora cayetanensis]|uniref:Probable serine/threonine-protein kinase fhkB n=1 Tax=Cyclospora cayetanensis TaxID=88456 RepID=A0A6P6S3U8_9EIME|nr:probable serine/threonine-protein kinase fhkB [Cyclospora cayetanensis]